MTPLGAPGAPSAPGCDPCKETATMHPRPTTCVTLAAFCLLAVASRPASSAAPRPAASPGRKAVERAVSFLLKDAAEWRKERKCATCHHGTMTVWALSEARSHGYPVTAEALADVTKWTRERLSNIDKPRDTRPGWNMVSTPAVYLAVMAQAVPKQDSVSADDLRQIAGHLLRHQEADGSWAWSLAPAKNRP